MQDYSGNWNPDFTWDMLDHEVLARFGREVMLSNQVHDNGMMIHLGSRFGAESMTRTAIDEWMGSSPVYSRRNQALHNVCGDTVQTIFKGLQLDIGAPHNWLKFHYELVSNDEGYFWLTSCGAYNYVREMTNGDERSETQICVHMEDPTFDATARATHPGATIRPLYRPPWPSGEPLPESGPCKWRVYIDRNTSAIPTEEVNVYTETIATSGAGQFEFSRATPTADGLADYSGDFKRDFCLEDLCHSTLVAQVKEFALDVHLLQRAAYSSLADNYMQPEAGEGEPIDHIVDWLLTEHWALVAAIYQKRLRTLFRIEGDDIEALLKLLQLDSFFVPEYLKLGMAKVGDSRASIWIEPCVALGDGQYNGLLTGFLQGRTAGFDRWVSSVNPRARVKAIEPGQCSETAAIAYEVWIDPQAEEVAPPALLELVGPNFDKADMTAHEFFYPA